MATRKRLTNNSDETDIASLMSGDTVFSIPYFQRAYKWKPERLTQLNLDLLSLVDETSDFHFLGAVIVHGRRSNPSDPDVYEVIDGQQRITTLFLYLCAVIQTLCKHAEYDEAAGLFLKYVAIGRTTKLLSNSKLHSCKDDRAQLNFVFTDLLSDATFSERLAPFSFQPLPASGSEKGRLRNNYRAACRFFGEQVEHEGLQRLKQLYDAMLNSMSVVQIDVWDPTNGPKIFDSLNSRQEPMTTGDLVRNEIFARVANRPPEQIEAIDQRSWQPFYKKFRSDDQSLFDSYFFPYGLTQDPNLRKSEVYAHLRTAWRDIDDPEAIVRQLTVYQDAFLDAVRGTNQQEHPRALAAAFLSLHEASAPSSTYPFLMQLSNAAKQGSVDGPEAVRILTTIESFLVRRAVCGHEPTGLHAVFKRLWQDCGGTPTAERTETEIRRHRTVTWPTADEFRNAIKGRPLYGTAVTPHLLVSWNRHLGGDQPASAPWVEHVLPENPDPEWFLHFSREQHTQLKDVLANLLPLSQAMNQSLSNKPYAAKRAQYLADSGFKAAREFAREYEAWDAAALEARAEQLASWAVQRWEH